jgi:preprotein translocase subunit SecA
MPRAIACSIPALALAALTACAQTPSADPTDHEAHHPPGTAAPEPAADPARTAWMQEHMKAMQAMHEKMAAAGTPQERQALMAEHMRLMQEGMSMMAALAPAMGMATMPGGPPTLETRQQSMEMRMDMMQSMMQMMLDRMAPPPAPK